MSFYKGAFIKGNWRKSRDWLQHRHASLSGGNVGVKSELWVSPTGCVWKHDHTLPAHTRPVLEAART